MKTVLHISSSSGPGGAERVACALAASLDSTQYRSLVALFRPGWLKDQCDARGVPTTVLSAEGFLHWKWMRDCYRLVKRERVDLIQAHEFDAIVHGWVVAKLAGIPLVATIHGKVYFWEKARRRWAYKIASGSATFVAVSQDLKRFVVETVGIPDTRVAVIHNGIDPRLLDVSTVDRAAVQRDLGIPEGNLVVGSVGNLYPVKGHTYLLDAIPSVLKHCPNTTFIFAGRGELEGALKEQARSLGIEANVKFLGLRQDIPNLLAAMDVFCMPSLSEGLSIALLEAMAAGKPVVVTNVGGNPEVVLNGKTGLLVEPQSGRELATALTQVLSDAVMRQSFAKAGKQRLVDDFSIAPMAAQYQQLYSGRGELRA
ncbi:MAG: glycosyltransferase [Nitrospiraceae bacterium]